MSRLPWKNEDIRFGNTCSTGCHPEVPKATFIQALILLRYPVTQNNIVPEDVAANHIKQ
jgi:hypothetical protein